MQICLSSLELVKGDVSTLIHQMELTYVRYPVYKQHGCKSKLSPKQNQFLRL